MTEKLPPFGRGTRVETLEVENPSTDWTEEVKATRRFGVTGRILDCHDSHGLCYDVLHDADGTQGCYEARELKELPEHAVLKEESLKVGLRCTICEVDLTPESVSLHVKCGTEAIPSLSAPNGNRPDLEVKEASQAQSGGFALLELIRIDFDVDENDAARAIDRETVAMFLDEPKETAHSKLKKFLEEMEPVKFYLSWDEEIYPRFVVESRSAL